MGSGIEEKVEVKVCDVAVGGPYDVEVLTAEGRNTEKGTGGVKPEDRPKLIPLWLYVVVVAAGCGGSNAGVGSSFTRAEPPEDPDFEVE